MARYRAVAGFPERPLTVCRTTAKSSGSNLTLTAQVLANTGSGPVQAATLLLDVVSTVSTADAYLPPAVPTLKGTTLNNTGTLPGCGPAGELPHIQQQRYPAGNPSGLGVKGQFTAENGTGRLYSAGNLPLDAQDFSGQGQVVATGDVTLKLIAALTNHGTRGRRKPFPSRRKMPSPTAV